MGVVREGEGCFWGEGREQGLRRALLSAVLVLELASFPAGLRADPSIDRIQDVGEHGLVAICRSPLAATGQELSMVDVIALCLRTEAAAWLVVYRPSALRARKSLRPRS